MEKYTHIVLVVDKSGSMGMVRDDAIGGFNAFIQEQKSIEGKATVTCTLFDNILYPLADFVSIENMPELSEQNYRPSGLTALYDAIGSTMDKVGQRLSKMRDKPDKVICAILTDGAENASKDYKQGHVKKMISHQEAKYSWQFIFLAATLEAKQEGVGLDISHIVTHDHTKKGTRQAYTTLNCVVRSSREAV